MIGGGPAGIAAAAAAARSGARTLLVERYGFLGGIATGGIVGTFCGFFTTGSVNKPVVGGIANAVVERLTRLGGVSGKTTSLVDPRIATRRYDPEILKLVADQVVIDHGAELLLHTYVVDVLSDEGGGRLRGVVTESKTGHATLLGKVLIDTTGDADLAFRAGVSYDFGDEHGRSQALTTMFRLMNVDPEQVRHLDLAEVREQLTQARNSGSYSFSRVDAILNPALPEGLLTVNVTNVPNMDGTKADDLTAAEIAGRQQVFEYTRALRDLVPGFQRAQVCALSTQVGVRETRRIRGTHTLQEDEVLKGIKFPDGIALGSWPVEIHDPDTRRIEWKFIERDDDYYSIPLGCLLPPGVENLLVAGRCASATHAAQASTRVIGQALAMGEAAGVAAAQAIEQGCPVPQVSVGRVQAELRRRGALLEA